ncbi:MAG: T9SS type A sorting domain-containing protein [Flavobacteriales bacterium]|nr:T9SS type A sorting domain-containing protein [Flavobacteriales bacterium]
MRHLLTLFVLLISTLTANAQVYGTPIVTWDFANGIPANWTNESNSGIGLWEYRGPNTTPNNTVCSRGSCGATSVPITSVSADNGFVIFDSNFWDDPNGPCGNIGSGPDPGPHGARLITNSINLTGYSAVSLAFQQQYKHYLCETSVHISVDGGQTWSLIHMNPGNNAFSASSVWVNVNLNTTAANQSDVRFKFEFTGNYYFWLLDDITVFVPSNNDLLLTNARFTQYDGTLAPSGFGDMEYFDYPTSMPPSMKFSSKITNIGGLTQNNVQMNVKVFNGANEQLYNTSTTAVNVASGVQISPSIFTPYVPPAVVDNYSIQFSAVQSQTDETPSNNIVTKNVRLTPFMYGRDKGSLEDTFFPSGIYEGEAYELGNVFEATVSNLRFHSIAVAFAEPSIPGTEVYGIVYNLSRTQILGTTEPYAINEWDINQVGEERMIHLQLNEDILLINDSAYIVMVGYNAAPEEAMFLGRSGPSPIQSSLISYPNLNGLFYMLRTPMVRMDIFPNSSVPGCMNAEAMNYEPEATMDDGSCRFPGCLNPAASNYDPTANFADDTCIIEGCTDPAAANYNEEATVENGTCLFPGCTDANATNYNETANIDDGSCDYLDAFISAPAASGCSIFELIINNQTAFNEFSTCLLEILDEAGTIVATFDTCSETWNLLLDTPGAYSADFFYTSGEFESSFSISDLVVFANPDQPSFSYDGTNLNCVGCDGQTIQWFLNGELIDGVETSSWEPTENGDYSVQITTADGCSATSETENIIVIGVHDAVFDLLRLYPNPFEDMFMIDGGNALVREIYVYDLTGRIVYSQSNINQNTVVIDGASWSNGAYLISIATESGIQNQRLVKR